MQLLYAPPMADTITETGPRTGLSPRAAWRNEAVQLLKLGVPLAVTQLAQMAILATDAIMLGHLNKDALAASALGNAVFWFAWLSACGPPSAVPSMIAHLVGDNPLEIMGVRHVVRMGLWAMVMVSAPLMLLLAYTRPILLALGQDPVLAGGAGLYLSTLCLALPFAVTFQVLRGFATALSRPIAPLVVMGLAILFNAAGDYALIFGHFGLPRLGLVGAGLSSTASNIFSVAVLLAIIRLHPVLKSYRIFRRLLRPDWPRLAELLRLGIPIGITMVFEVMLFNCAALVMGLFGTASLAAHQIAILIPSTTFMVPLGIGMAATVRVGLAAGAGDTAGARRAGFTAMGLGALFMCGTSLLLLLFPQNVARLFLSDDPANKDVIALAVTFLHVAAAFQIVDGLQVTASLSLRGLKDARAPMWIAGAAYWIAGAPACLLLAFVFRLQGFGIWLGLAFGLFVAAAALVTRFALLSARQIGDQADHHNRQSD